VNVVDGFNISGGFVDESGHLKKMKKHLKKTANYVSKC
jgi:hypothetical protein